MIITIKKFPDFSINKPRKLRAVQSVLTAFGEGKHLLWMPIEVVDALIKLSGLCEYSIRVLYELRELVVEMRNVERKFNFHVELDFDSPFTLDYVGQKFVVGYECAADSGYFQAARFLAEDALDCEVLSKGAEVFLSRDKSISSACTVKFENCPGGGSSTRRNFDRLVSEKKLFLCVIDSDMHHPCGPLGDTATLFNDINRGFNAHYMLEVLDCHELENIIPYRILCSVADGWEQGLVLKQKNKIEFRRYLDHKAGVKVGQALALDRKHNSKYWSWLVDHKVEDEKWLCPPLGKKFLSACNDFMNKESAVALSKFIDPGEDAIWDSVSALVASWGVSPRKIIK